MKAFNLNDYDIVIFDEIYLYSIDNLRKISLKMKEEIIDEDEDDDGEDVFKYVLNEDGSRKKDDFGYDALEENKKLIFCATGDEHQLDAINDFYIDIDYKKKCINQTNIQDPQIEAFKNSTMKRIT